MFYKNVLNSVRSSSTALQAVPTQVPQQSSSTPARLVLVTSGSGGTPQTQAISSGLVEFVAISAHRCASFFAEASVLVLVLALLDRFMASGHMQRGWIIGSVAISLTLLAASIATDFTSRRWLRAH
jgi:hypothetical protein